MLPRELLLALALSLLVGRVAAFLPPSPTLLRLQSCAPAKFALAGAPLRPCTAIALLNVGVGAPSSPRGTSGVRGLSARFSLRERLFNRGQRARKGVVVRSYPNDDNSILSMMSEELSEDDARALFYRGAAFEIALGVIALLLDKVLKLGGIWPELSLSRAALLQGLVASVPLILGVVIVRFIRIRAFRDVEQLSFLFARKIFSKRSILQVAAFCAAAGIGEELLFRGVFQPFLSRIVGFKLGMFFVGLIFGMAHWLSPAYFFLTMCASVILSTSFVLSGGNVVVPMIAHAMYDFIAVLYVLKAPPKDLLEGREY